MSTQLMERPTPMATPEATHAAAVTAEVPAEVPVKQLLRWQDDGGATHPEVERA